VAFLFCSWPLVERVHSNLCLVVAGQPMAPLPSSAACRRWMLCRRFVEVSSPEVGANVVHLFSNAINQEQGNTIVSG
jgi:hypothetical protein